MKLILLFVSLALYGCSSSPEPVVSADEKGELKVCVKEVERLTGRYDRSKQRREVRYGSEC